MYTHTHGFELKRGVVSIELCRLNFCIRDLEIVNSNRIEEDGWQK